MYVLKEYDEPVVKFRLQKPELDDYKIEVMEFYKRDLKYYPFGIKTDKDILDWCRQRVIPRNRRFVNRILETQNLKVNDMIGILNISYGLSVNDSFWLVPEGRDLKFKDYNLYENSFSEALSLVAFTGVDSKGDPDSLSPEWTTTGNLAKCWRRINDELYLFKSGNDIDPHEIKYEPYSEYYVSKIAEHLNIDHTAYDLEVWKGKLSSVCKCFCDIDHSFIPAYKIIGNKLSYAEMKKHILEMGFEKEFSNMILLDAVTFNADRHLGNFGFIQNNHTKKIERFAPLFDHGMALFGNAGEYTMNNDEALQELKNVANISAAWNISYEELLADNVLEDTDRKLRKLLNYKITKHGTYDLDDSRLSKINKMMNEQAGYLLGMIKTKLKEEQLTGMLKENPKEKTEEPAKKNKRIELEK